MSIWNFTFTKIALTLEISRLTCWNSNLIKSAILCTPWANQVKCNIFGNNSFKEAIELACKMRHRFQQKGLDRIWFLLENNIVMQIKIWEAHLNCEFLFVYRPAIEWRESTKNAEIELPFTVFCCVQQVTFSFFSGAVFIHKAKQKILYVTLLGVLCIVQCQPNTFVTCFGT